MQHTGYSYLNQSGVDKESSSVALPSAPLPLLSKPEAGVELLVFCIHLFSIQTSSVFQSISFSGICLFSSLSFLIIVSIDKIYAVTMKSLLSVHFPSMLRATLFQFVARSH